MDPIFAGVHPVLIEKINRVLAAMAILGYPMKAYQGVRTTAQQAVEYAKGRTKPGPNPSHQRPLGQPVTYCDGVIMRSNHQVSSDGYGHAVDLCAAGVVAFPPTFPWALLRACVEAVGLISGASFAIRDLDHAELPQV